MVFKPLTKTPDYYFSDERARCPNNPKVTCFRRAVALSELIADPEALATIASPEEICELTRKDQVVVQTHLGWHTLQVPESGCGSETMDSGVNRDCSVEVKPPSKAKRRSLRKKASKI